MSASPRPGVVLLMVLFLLAACSSNLPAPLDLPTASLPTHVIASSAANPSSTPTPFAPPASPVLATATPAPLSLPTPYSTPPATGQPVLIPILMYHHLNVLGANPSQTLLDWTVSPDQFAAQLDYLLAQGYHTITFAQLVTFFEDGVSLPEHPVILTFDDGWLEDYSVAFPALRIRGLVGTFFVPTAYADAGGKTLMSWTQIKEMDAAGMEFGGHTLNHANLKEVSAAEAVRQLTVSKAKLEAELGHATIAFAYPFGWADPAILSYVKQAGYQAAVGLCCGYRLRGDELLFLPRIRIGYAETLDTFSEQLPLPERAFPLPRAVLLGDLLAASPLPLTLR